MHERARQRLVADLAEGNRRSARSAECRRCGAPVLTGDDHDEIAAAVTVDAEPVNPVDEMLAIFDGRLTFNLSRQGGKNAPPGARCLHARYDWHVHGERDLGTVHIEHRCDPAARRDHRTCTTPPSLFPELTPSRRAGTRRTA